MKRPRKSLIFIGVLMLIICTLVAFTACGKCAHNDADCNNVCDKCGEEIIPGERSVMLVDSEGKLKFKIVMADGLSDGAKRMISDLKKDLNGIGITLEVLKDDGEDAQDCEVLIGSVTSRGEEYEYDVRSLGVEGYVIKIINSKVIINAGSDEMLLTAIEKFITGVLGYTSDTTSLSKVVMTSNQEREYIQTGYKITSLSVSGNDMQGYTIAIDKSSDRYMEAALYLQDAIYAKTGYFLEIVSLDEADRSIIIKGVPKKAGMGSFKAFVNLDGQIVMECAYENKAYDGAAAFFVDNISIASGDVNLEGELTSLDISVVYYEDFGAKGDGKTNDFLAIRAAHEFANECGQTVKSKNPSKAKYYISDTTYKDAVGTINVRTNVDLGGAHVIIDDSNLTCTKGTGMHYTHVFIIEPDYEMVKITDKEVLDRIAAAGLGPDTKKIDLELGYDAMIIPYDTSHKIYRRRGYGGWAGYDMREITVIDAEGNVDPKTPLAFNFTRLDYIEVYRIDEEPIVFENAIFTTMVSKFNTVYTTSSGTLATRDSNYFKRGIEVWRSNTTLKNIEHYLTGEFTIEEQIEGKVGVAYNGFFAINNSNNVLLDSCVLTGHRCFWKGFIGSSGTQGTYDMQIFLSNKTVFRNCTQSNFWVNDYGQAVSKDTYGAKMSLASSTQYGNSTPRMYWGIGGSNDAKNMEYYNCVLSRFDAHRGMLNGVIKDSEICSVSLVGGGDILIENVTWYAEDVNSNSLVGLRSDYGAPWNGTIRLKNITAYPSTDKFEKDSPTGDYRMGMYVSMTLIGHSYQNWDFGYECVYPNVELDGIVLYDLDTKQRINTSDIFINFSSSYQSEPNLHLDTVANIGSKPIYADVDTNNDGFVDGTNIPFDGKTDRNGVSPDYPDNKNLNPVRPPEYITLKNINGYEIRFSDQNTTFFDNTYIEIEGVRRNKSTD